MSYDVELGLRNRGPPNGRSQNDNYARQFDQNSKMGKELAKKGWELQTIRKCTMSDKQNN